MLRRTFLAGTIAVATLVTVPALASDDTIEFMPGDIKSELDAGKTVFVDYYTTWCGTCRRQGRIVDNLRAKNPEYNKAMTFIKVDWDVYASHEVSTSRNIPRRSTLIVLKGDKELGRIVAGTSEDEIKALMDKGLTSTTPSES